MSIRPEHGWLIFAGEILAGHLVEHTPMSCSLIYEESWIQKGYALSPYLPLTGEFSDGDVSRFLRNLIPEGYGLATLLSSQHESRLNTCSLLKYIAIESAGSLRFVCNGLPEVKQQELTIEMLSSRLKNDSNIVVWNRQFRLQVAGVQKKVNVHIRENDSMWLATEDAISTHIIKVRGDSSRNDIINEWFCMMLAKAIGLEVAEVSLLEINDEPALLVTRFDREPSYARKIRRHHIIDGCQALNLPPDYKYEQPFGRGPDVSSIRDGASLKALFNFAKVCQHPSLAQTELLKWVAFNLVIGNGDAHAKNISFFVNEEGITPAPLYDLLSTVLLGEEDPNLDINLSMAIGDEFDINNITAFHLLSFAEECDIAPNKLKGTLQQIALDCKKVSSIELCNGENLKPEALTTLSKLTTLINQRADHFLNECELFVEIHHSLF